jgi:hypothetical protein
VREAAQRIGVSKTALYEALAAEQTPNVGAAEIETIR